MTRAITTARHSRSSDRPVVPSQNPFRSASPSKRVANAQSMLEQRREEMELLQRALDVTTSAREQARLAMRILATQNNIRSWETYLQEAEREPRAVIAPKARR